MSDRCIRRVRATPVVVPAKPDSLNSSGIADEDAGFLQKFKLGGYWSDFVHMPKWIIELETGEGAIGIGESYRTVSEAELEPTLSVLLGADPLALSWRALPIENRRLYDAYESAVLDLAGKSLGVPVYQLLGGKVRDSIECLGWTARRTPADAARKAHEAMEQGHRVFKFKIAESDSPREWCAAIKERCGEGMKVLLDPNQRWGTVNNTLELMRGVDLSVMYGLEDPIERQDYAGFQTLKAELGIPIFIHISLPYLHQGQRVEDILPAIRTNCADGYNFNGSMFAFVELCKVAQWEGKPVWHGSEVDLGILETSYLHACAAAESCTIPSDIFGERVREDDLVLGGVTIKNGHAAVPETPGLGIELDRTALERYRVGETVTRTLTGS